MLEIQPEEDSQRMVLQASQPSFDIPRFLGVQGHVVDNVVTRAFGRRRC